MRLHLIIALLFYPLLFGTASAEGLDSLTGVWRTVRHDALVEIADCGDATPCGTLAWASEAVLGGNTLDARNVNKALRTRRLIGVPVIWGFQRTASGWTDGRIYNPEDGKTFRATLRMLSNDELRVTGCFGPLCRGQTWTRVTTQIAGD